MSIQAWSGIGKGVYKPCGITFDFAFLQQCNGHKIYARYVSYGANRNAHTMFLKLFVPAKCSIKPPLCTTLTSKSLIEHLGTHNIFSLNM